jgi:hypothetical protein
MALECHNRSCENGNKGIKNGLKLSSPVGRWTGRRSTRSLLGSMTDTDTRRGSGNGAILLAFHIRSNPQYVIKLANRIRQLLGGSNGHAIIVHVVVRKDDIVIVRYEWCLRERVANGNPNESIVRQSPLNSHARETDTTNLGGSCIIIIKSKG